MTKIAIIVDGDYEFPIYRDEGLYLVDLGGSFGMSDPLFFSSDVEAIVALREAYEDDCWEMIA